MPLKYEGSARETVQIIIIPDARGETPIPSLILANISNIPDAGGETAAAALKDTCLWYQTPYDTSMIKGPPLSPL